MIRPTVDPLGRVVDCYARFDLQKKYLYYHYHWVHHQWCGVGSAVGFSNGQTCHLETLLRLLLPLLLYSELFGLKPNLVFVSVLIVFDVSEQYLISSDGRVVDLNVAVVDDLSTGPLVVVLRANFVPSWWNCCCSHCQPIENGEATNADLTSDERLTVSL